MTDIVDEPMTEPVANDVPEVEDETAKSRFEVKKWSAVAFWSWDIAIENCAICRNHIMDTCIDCQAAEGSARPADCTVSWGVCNHTFHSHCITRWLKSRAVCPLDNMPWETQKYGR